MTSQSVLISEQTKISNFLSAIDEKTELVSNQIQNNKNIKKGYYNKCLFKK